MREADHSATGLQNDEWIDLGPDPLPVELETTRVTWKPDPSKRYKWPSGDTSGPGCYFTPDGTGGGTLEFKSPTTMRWMKIQKKPHGV